MNSFSDSFIVKKFFKMKGGLPNSLYFSLEGF